MLKERLWEWLAVTAARRKQIQREEREARLVMLDPPYPLPGDVDYLSAAGDHQRNCRHALRFLCCTRAAGHVDDHAAHGPDDQMMARWPQESGS